MWCVPGAGSMRLEVIGIELDWLGVSPTKFQVLSLLECLRIPSAKVMAVPEGASFFAVW